jgi:Secretion system C-terminal sorting domain
MKRIFTLIFVFTLVSPFAQIASWDFSPLLGGTDNFGPSPLAPTTSDANVTVVGLTRGSGLGTTGTGAGRAWGGNTYSTSGDPAVAIAANSFWTFSIAPNSGKKMSLSGIDAYNIRRSASGAQKGQWQYQVGSGAFVNIGTEITWGAVTTSAGNAQPAIVLSGISALQNVSGTTITFRIVNYGATGTGTCYFFDETFPASTDIDLNITGVTTALPVELTTFNANVNKSTTKLAWQTASEKNNAFFAIERSVDGDVFSKIGEVKGNGTSTITQNYQYTDAAPVKGINYYRLRQVDFDGTEDVSKTVSVNFDGKGGSKAKVYPTLVSNLVNIELSSDAKTALSVSDVTGRVILTQNTEGAYYQTMNLGTLSSGLYFLNIRSNEGTETVKIYKQ